MKFTKELIYQNCAKRIEQRIEEKKLLMPKYILAIQKLSAK